MVDAKPPPPPPEAAADDAEETNLKDEQRPPQVGEETKPNDDDTAAAAANLIPTAAEPQQGVKSLVADAEDKDHPHPETTSPLVGDRLIANTHTDPAQGSKLKAEENEDMDENDEEVNNALVANTKMEETSSLVNEDDKSSAQLATENDDDKHVPSETKMTKKKGMPKPPPKLDVAVKTPPPPTKSFLSVQDGYESGTEDEQAAFMKDVEIFYKVNNLEFKPPKFYKEELNLLKLWRQVIKLGGYGQVTSCKLWRQVGESFRPPKTCTTVSWTFRIFYEKALLEYEKGKLKDGELQLPFSDGPLTEAIRVENQAGGSQALGSGRTRRDAAARAMKSWHSQHLLGNGEVCHPIIKDKSLSSTPKGDKQLKTNGLLKRKRPSTVEHAVLVGHRKPMKTQGNATVIDVGAPAEWVKINVQRTNDCFEVYALVPGLLREEVHVQSDPAGRLIISGQPEQLDNPWGVTPFKKVVSLPSKIDPHQTSAVVTLHGQLFVRVPFEQ